MSAPGDRVVRWLNRLTLLCVNLLCLAAVAGALLVWRIPFDAASVDAWYAERGLPPYLRLVPGRVGRGDGNDFIRYGRETEYRINAAGLRDRELVADPGLRVAMLGDSMTYGSDAAFETLFTERLEAALAGGPAPIEVLNCGNPGSNLRGELAFYRDVVAPLQPRVVIWQILSNDHEDDQYFYRRYAQTEGTLRWLLPGIYDPLLKWAQRQDWRANPYYRFARRRFDDFNASLSEEELRVRFWDPLEQGRAVFGADVRVWVLLFSLPPGIEDAAFRAALIRHGYGLIDARPLLRLPTPPPELVLHPELDHHLSAKGHARVATLIEAELGEALRQLATATGGR